MARVISVNLSRKTGVKKNPVPGAVALVDKGFQNDAHAQGGQRQISMLALESIQKMIDQGANVAPGAFAENITTEGIDLLQVPVGNRIRVGETLLEVTRHGKECPAPCAIYHQVGYCVMPTDGIFVRVLEGGWIRPNDPIRLEDNL